MGDRSEPVRKYDTEKWNSAWDRIRANQAKQRAEAAAAELRDADARPVPDHLPPLPPSTRYGGVLDEYDDDLHDCYTCDPIDGLGWTHGHTWIGMKNIARDGIPDDEWTGLWHVAVPVEQQP